MNQNAPTSSDATAPPAGKIADFIRRWDASGAAERANYALFLTQLCDLLGVPQPEPTTDDVEKNAYVFERDVTFQDDDGSTSIGRIDLYKRACFVLEAKQGSDAAEDDPLSPGPQAGTKKKKGTAVRGTPAWDDAMIRARGQADRYARALPGGEGWPAFLIVVDVGHVIELYSEFTRQGKTYVPFPDPQSFRIKLADLADPSIRERLKLVWTDPLALDPSRKSAKVTRELASRLAELAKLLEKAGHDPACVARFLMRCLFTMFAEDVELIPKDAFKKLLTELEGNPAAFPPMIESLWQTMNAGGFSTILRQTVLRFNGGLFAEHEALPLTAPMLKLLRQASEAFWGDVEPAIFGTLLERALDPVERHKLGAHYTPRAYVERLVLPTIIEPLRDEWNTTYATALAQARAGKLEQAHTLVRQFHEKLCDTRVLDPACGSGNFLYVTLEHMKRLEGEVLNALRELGYQQKILLEIDPHQFLGIEINPRAAAIADLVLWIGYLQWHFRTRGKATPAEPIIKDYKNIKPGDAVLAYDGAEPLLDESGQPVTRWDGRTTKRHPVTGEEVPDETARTAVLQYINPRKAEWPEAEFIVGNPPYLGARTNRLALGDSYLASLRRCYEKVPENCDYVMYWWDKAAELTNRGKCRRFGLITTKSIGQEFARKLLGEYIGTDGPLSFRFAIPNHPWIDSSDGADVRVALTVSDRSASTGRLLSVTQEEGLSDGEVAVKLSERIGKILPNLSIGSDVSGCDELRSNDGMSCVGYQLTGQGFVVDDVAIHEQGFDAKPYSSVVRSFCTARDLAQTSRRLHAIDLFGLSLSDVQRDLPKVFQWIVNRVKPERDANNRTAVRENWWLYGECRSTFRPALIGLPRLIVTPLTAKHRFFLFAPADTVCDSTCVMFAFDSATVLGVLSSRVHLCWFRASGRLGVGNDPRYLKRQCFDPFPFPEWNDASKQRMGDLAEQLDAHRKRQQGLHPGLTLTDMYNVLEKLRAADRLAPASTPGSAGADGKPRGRGG